MNRSRLPPLRAMLGTERTQRYVSFLRNSRQGRSELLRLEAKMGRGKFGPIRLEKARFRRSVQDPERG